jgi:uncharacterized membrane protein YeaQ/YmgE (transglycosylase-associated protein family)
MKKVERARMKKRLPFVALFSVMSYPALAVGDASSALSAMLDPVRKVFTTAINVMYAVAAVAGLIGAITLYQKWNSGDPNTGKLVGAWIGAAVFLALAATFLRTMFIS